MSVSIARALVPFPMSAPEWLIDKVQLKWFSSIKRTLTPRPVSNSRNQIHCHATGRTYFLIWDIMTKMAHNRHIEQRTSRKTVSLWSVTSTSQLTILMTDEIKLKVPNPHCGCRIMPYCFTSKVAIVVEVNQYGFSLLPTNTTKINQSLDLSCPVHV